MKKENHFYIILLIEFIFLHQIYAQLQFTHHTIDSAYFISAHVTDLDSDGDIDFLTAVKFGDGIYWYDNDDWQHFIIQHLPHPNIWAGYIVYAVDLDQDGDVDILSAGGGSKSDLEWFENDGNENFTQHYFNIKTTGVTSISAIDMDNDEDIDVLVSTEFYDPWLTDRTISWYENDGSENFSRHIITTSVSNARFASAIDIDDDGDMDVISTSFDRLAWYENDGNENFSTHTVTITDVYTYSVHALDIDNDEDIDIISAAYKEIAWYENDGYQNFTKHIITTELAYFLSVFAIDIDSDKDIDVVAASSSDGIIIWYENDSEQNFIPHIITTKANGVFFVYPVDVDNDTDIDLFSASDVYPDSGIIDWYENLMIVGSNENYRNYQKVFSLSQNYPNPFNPSTKIEFEVKEMCVIKLKIYDMNGQLVTTLIDKIMVPGNYSYNFNAANLASGVYFYQIQMDEFQDVKKMILMR